MGVDAGREVSKELKGEDMNGVPVLMRVHIDEVERLVNVNHIRALLWDQKTKKLTIRYIGYEQDEMEGKEAEVFYSDLAKAFEYRPARKS